VLTQGNVADHIRKNFGKGSFDRFSPLDDLEHRAISTLQEYGLIETEDFFELPLQLFDKDTKNRFVEDRSTLLGFDQLFRQVDPQAKQAADSAFRIMQAPDGLERGFGSFVLDRSEFIGQTNVDEVAAKLSLIMPSIGISPESMGSTLHMPGKALRREFLRSQAEQIVGDLDVNAKYLYFDLETTGLARDSKIWQMSARMGDETLDLNFSGVMDGLFTDGNRPMRFEEFFEYLQGSKVEWTDDFAEGMTKFLRMASEADYLVAHNAPFDVERVATAIGKMRHSGTEEFKTLADAFLNKASEHKVVDTRVLSKALFGKDILDSAHGKALSMENILLETSALSDIAEKRLGAKFAGEVSEEALEKAQGHRGWAAIHDRLGGSRGLHGADVDTWILQHVHEMQRDILSGRAKDVLRIESLKDSGLRAAIGDASALTPTTRITELGGLTPIELLAHETRRFDSTPFVAADATLGQLYETGLYSQWSQSIFSRSGQLRGEGLLDSNFAHIPGLHDAIDATVQGRAISANLPFAGLSSFERLFSTEMGTIGSEKLPGGLNRTRELLGELTGSGAFRSAKEVKFWSDRNLALPLELLREAEAEQALPKRVASILDQGAEKSEDLIRARYSFFSYRDKKQALHRDTALVVDLFESKKEVDKFLDFLEGRVGKYGLTEDMLKNISKSSENIRAYGVQLGTIGSDANQERIHRLAAHAGLDLDTSAMQMSTLLEGVIKGGDKEEFITTTSSFLDRGRGAPPGTGGIFHEQTDWLFDQYRNSRELNRAIRETSKDPLLTIALRDASVRADPVRARNIHRTMTNMVPQIGKVAGVAGIALGAYYLFNRSREQAHYNEVLSHQGYEDPNFYENYKRGMGEQAPHDYERQHMESLGSKREMDAMVTAGIVGRLDREKIGHHAMGSNKNDHLFGG